VKYIVMFEGCFLLSDGEYCTFIWVVTSSIPQGTVLGPILFLIYINDFPEYLTHSKLRLFADDSIIYKEITCQDDCKKLQF
jgi:hypothetical protein